MVRLNHNARIRLSFLTFERGDLTIIHSAHKVVISLIISAPRPERGRARETTSQLPSRFDFGQQTGKACATPNSGPKIENVIEIKTFSSPPMLIRPTLFKMGVPLTRSPNYDHVSHKTSRRKTTQAISENGVVHRFTFSGQFVFLCPLAGALPIRFSAINYYWPHCLLRGIGIYRFLEECTGAKSSSVFISDRDRETGRDPKFKQWWISNGNVGVAEVVTQMMKPRCFFRGGSSFFAFETSLKTVIYCPFCVFAC